MQVHPYRKYASMLGVSRGQGTYSVGAAVVAGEDESATIVASRRRWADRRVRQRRGNRRESVLLPLEAGRQWRRSW